jgi:hypothetical protein
VASSTRILKRIVAMGAYPEEPEDARELDADGEGRAVDHAVAYRRVGGTSYWMWIHSS